jgi:cytochrome P450
MNLPRVAPAKGIEIGDKFLPAGTVIGANPWVVHCNEEAFGKDVGAFRPGRWLEEINPAWIVSFCL